MAIVGKSRLLVDFGRRVREMRHVRRLTQEDLAAKSGLDRSYVGQVERGERNISLENIGILADALGVSPAELLSPPDASDPEIPDGADRTS